MRSGTRQTINSYFGSLAFDEDGKSVILALCGAAIEISALAAQTGLTTEALGDTTGAQNSDGDQQKQLDVLADEIVSRALGATALGAYFSEERDDAVIFSQKGMLSLSCDPLDGSSNIDTNLTIGTIFSLFRHSEAGIAGKQLPHGREQIAAGFFAYGPQTSLLISCGDSVVAFGLDQDGLFRQLDWQIAIPAQTAEFAINASNARHWMPPVKRYIEQCVAGIDGARKKNFNMRWAGSLVADAWRIFRRGGVFLYPEDSRSGYEHGRLRLIYEAYAIAFLVEQAGGLASDGKQMILDIMPEQLHQRTPLVFGSKDEINHLLSYYR